MKRSIEAAVVVRKGVVVVVATVCAGLLARSFAAEDDHEFMPLHGWRTLGETGEDDVTLAPAEGFPGLKDEPPKDRWIEPIDGDGGFDNVAPRLAAEEGPGGLEWDPSPTYRTRYKYGRDYPPSENRPLGHNWFTKIPYAEYDNANDTWVIRFDANTVRFFDADSDRPGTYWGRFGNRRAKLVHREANPALLQMYDIGGKVYTFSAAENYRCTKIEPIGLAEIEIIYSVDTISVLQKLNAQTEVRRFRYVLADYGHGARIDRIEVAAKNGVWGIPYRTIDFTYHEEVREPVGSSIGDLVGIEEELALSESGQSYRRRWAFKYYVGPYDSASHSGHAHQVAAVLGPGAMAELQRVQPGTNAYERSVGELQDYLERTYTYYSDKRLRSLALENQCDCGAGAGTHRYSWQQNASASNLNVWFSQAAITLPAGGRHFIDYNRYGQILNRVLQEDAADPESRRWIKTYRRGHDGRLAQSYSVAACLEYRSHVVTTKPDAGMRRSYNFVQEPSTLAWTLTERLRDPTTRRWNLQRKKVFSLRALGDRRRFLKTSETVYPQETTDGPGTTTQYGYETFHVADRLAVALRKTTRAPIPVTQNGSGQSVVLYDYFEDDLRHSWTRDGEGYVSYREIDPSRRVTTLNVLDFDSDRRPAGVPVPPDAVFLRPGGANLVTTHAYDLVGRIKKSESAAFEAWTGTGLKTTRTTQRWHYDKLSSGELVVLAYPHIDDVYYHAAISLAVFDPDGRERTTASGELIAARRDINFEDDFDGGAPTIEEGFQGVLLRRTDTLYRGREVAEQIVWSDPTDASAPRQRTVHTYDAAGRLTSTRNPSGSITRFERDVLGRLKSVRIGTIDGGRSDNMTLIEERFYDGEEAVVESVGDGYLTRKVLYTHTSEGERATDYRVDYRGRVVAVHEPLRIRESRTYDNLGRVTRVERFNDRGRGVLLSRVDNFYDPWEQIYESREYGVRGGEITGFLSMSSWRDGRGFIVKTRSQGARFEKTRYDGAGRIIARAASYDADESAYEAAHDLVGDTVVAQTVYLPGPGGGAELIRAYSRRHDAEEEATGSLTVGVQGTGRGQYTAIWRDELGRLSRVVRYGTNGGIDLDARPQGEPPAVSGPLNRVREYTYTLLGEIEERRGPAVSAQSGDLVTQRTEYTGWGAVALQIGNFADGIPGSVDDRTIVYGYDAAGRLSTKTVKAAAGEVAAHDRVTAFVYGVTHGSGDSASRLASNDLIRTIRFPDPITGAAGGPDDQVHFAYNAQGEQTYMEDQRDTKHVYEYDQRGRLVVDHVTDLGDPEVDGRIRKIGRSYDALDRAVRVRSYGEQGYVEDEVVYGYGAFGVVETVHQEWRGAVDPGVSNKVTYDYHFPKSATDSLKRVSTTYPSGVVVLDVYEPGVDTAFSRPSGAKMRDEWLFRDVYLGLSRVVEREYGDLGIVRTLVGDDEENSDGYAGLDRFGRIDDLLVTDGRRDINRFVYEYNDRSQVVVRRDDVGRIDGRYLFDEEFSYDDAGRLVEHQRGENPRQSTAIDSHECWTLDSVGNWLEYYRGDESFCGTPSLSSVNASDELTQVDATRYSYDRAGNMVGRDDGVEFVYDAWNRLVAARSGSSVLSAYRYNGLHQRISAGESQWVESDYYYSTEGNLLEEWYADDDVARWYVWGGDQNDIVLRSSSRLSSSFEFYVTDAFSNVVTRLSSDGAVSGRYLYDGNGHPTRLSADWTSQHEILEDDFLFAGRRYISQHGLHDFGLRVHDADLGVFVQRDPLLIGGSSDGRHPYRMDETTDDDDWPGSRDPHDDTSLGPYGCPLPEDGSPYEWNKFIECLKRRRQAPPAEGMPPCSKKGCRWSGFVWASFWGSPLIAGLGKMRIAAYATDTTGCQYFVRGKGDLTLGAFAGFGFVEGSATFQNKPADCEWPIEKGSHAAFAVVTYGGLIRGVPVAVGMEIYKAGQFQVLDGPLIGGLAIAAGGGGVAGKLTEVEQWGPAPGLQK